MNEISLERNWINDQYFPTLQVKRIASHGVCPWTIVLMQLTVELGFWTPHKPED